LEEVGGVVGHASFGHKKSQCMVDIDGAFGVRVKCFDGQSLVERVGCHVPKIDLHGQIVPGGLRLQHEEGEVILDESAEFIPVHNYGSIGFSAIAACLVHGDGSFEVAVPELLVVQGKVDGVKEVVR